MKLSDERAKSVRKYLVDHGVEADRLIAKGFGITKPLAPNDTEEGREKNRRVEFNIMEQDVTKRKVEIDPATGKEKVIEETKTTVSKPVAPEETADAKKDTKDVKKDAKKAEGKDGKGDAKHEHEKPMVRLKVTNIMETTTRLAQLRPKGPSSRPRYCETHHRI